MQGGAHLDISTHTGEKRWQGLVPVALQLPPGLSPSTWEVVPHHNTRWSPRCPDPTPYTPTHPGTAGGSLTTAPKGWMTFLVLPGEPRLTISLPTRVWVGPSPGSPALKLTLPFRPFLKVLVLILGANGIFRLVIRELVLPLCEGRKDRHRVSPQHPEPLTAAQEGVTMPAAPGELPVSSLNPTCPALHTKVPYPDHHPSFTGGETEAGPRSEASGPLSMQFSQTANSPHLLQAPFPQEAPTLPILGVHGTPACGGHAPWSSWEASL